MGDSSGARLLDARRQAGDCPRDDRIVVQGTTSVAIHIPKEYAEDRDAETKEAT
jgi:hypothetical protein